MRSEAGKEPWEVEEGVLVLEKPSLGERVGARNMVTGSSGCSGQGLSQGVGGGESSGWLPAVWEPSVQELLMDPMREVLGRCEAESWPEWLVKEGAPYTSRGRLRGEDESSGHF